MTPTEADDLTARVLTVIHERLDELHPALRHGALNLNADRRRLVSDLAGLRDHAPWGPAPWQAYYCTGDHPKDWDKQPDADWPCSDARRYVDGLRLTASLYGVTP